MTFEIPDFIRRAMEAQGKVDPDEVAARVVLLQESGELEASPMRIPSAIGDQKSHIDDHALQARKDDPRNSHRASDSVGGREGSTGTFTPRTHKHLILRVYADAKRPLTDTEAWQAAGIHYRSGAWHRCSDMLDARVIEQVDDVVDGETGSLVRRCQITPSGRIVSRRLEAGETVKLND